MFGLFLTVCLPVFILFMNLTYYNLYSLSLVSFINILLYLALSRKMAKKGVSKSLAFQLYVWHKLISFLVYIGVYLFFNIVMS